MSSAQRKYQDRESITSLERSQRPNMSPILSSCTPRANGEVVPTLPISGLSLLDALIRRPKLTEIEGMNFRGRFEPCLVI